MRGTFDPERRSIAKVVSFQTSNHIRRRGEPGSFRAVPRATSVRSPIPIARSIPVRSARVRTHAIAGPRRGFAVAGVGALALGLIGAALPVALATSASAATTAGAATVTDAFGRTSTAGCGTAPTGGAWTSFGGTATDYTVNDGVASMLVRQAGWQLASALLTTKVTDSELQARVSTDKLVAGGNLDV